MKLLALAPALVLVVLSLTGCERDVSPGGDLGVEGDLAGSDLAGVQDHDAANGDGPTSSTPQVTSTNPAQGASNICIPAGVEVTFDRDMDTMTLTPTQVLLAGPGAISRALAMLVTQPMATTYKGSSPVPARAVWMR